MKRTILPVLLALCMLLTLPVYAASGRLTATAAVSGDQVTVTVHLDNPGIVATRIFVRYDSGVLQLKSAENGDVFPKSNAEFGKDLTNDPYTMLWLDGLRHDNITASGTLCTLTFAVTGGTESGKTSVRIEVDHRSTFDVDLNEVTVADGSCDVPVPVGTAKDTQTTTKATTTSTTTKPSAAQPTTTKPTTTKTTTAAGTPAGTTTTTKPVPTTASKSAVTGQRQPTTAATTKNAASGKTTAPNASAGSTTASSATAAASVPATAVQGSTAAAAQTDKTTADAAEPDETVIGAASDETVPELLTADGALTDETETAAAETATETQDDTESSANHLGLLWLLLLIPAAAVVIVIVKKKKA